MINLGQAADSARLLPSHHEKLASSLLSSERER